MASQEQTAYNGQLIQHPLDQFLGPGAGQRSTPVSYEAKGMIIDPKKVSGLSESQRRKLLAKNGTIFLLTTNVIYVVDNIASTPECQLPEEFVYIDRRISFNHTSRELTVRGQPVKLSTVQGKILKLFTKYPNRVLPYDYMTNNVFGYATPINNPGGQLKGHIRNLRQKLATGAVEKEEDPIETVINVGYMFHSFKDPQDAVMSTHVNGRSQTAGLFPSTANNNTPKLNGLLKE